MPAPDLLSTSDAFPGIVAVVACMAVLIMTWGYLLWLRAHQRDLIGRGSARPSEPPVDVIVAVHNEADQIEGKLADLRELHYPADRLRFWIVDGQSTDGTLEIAARCIQDDPRFRMLEERPDKTAQLNAALSHCSAPWILVTDADARMHPEALVTLVGAAGSDGSVGAVGVPVQPVESCHWLEALHWRVSNHVRHLESLAGCASIVTAPCYLLRRECISRLPEDVVADDIHVALAVSLKGYRTRIAETRVIELRAPRSLSELFRHKLRKTLAYQREVYRFLPALWRMPRAVRAVFAWRAVQLLLLPWTVAIAAVALIASVPTELTATLVASGIAVAAASLVMSAGDEHGPRAALTGVALGLFLFAVFMVAFVTYPFHPRSACFLKVGVARRAGVRT